MSLLVTFLILGTSLAQAQDPASDEAALRSYLSANGLLNRGLYELAEDEYRRFLKEAPRHEKADTARYGLAVCLLRTGRLEAAARELDPLVERDAFEFHAEALAMRGQCALAASDYPRAAQLFHRVVERHAEHDLADDAAALEVEALFRAGEPAAAVKAAQRFAARWPKSAARERVEYFGAISAFTAGQYPAASAALRELLERFPAGEFAASATLLLAQAYQQSSEYEKSAESYERVLRDEKSPLRGDALLGFAAVRQAQQRWKDCAALAEQFLSTDPDTTRADDALAMLGRAGFEEGRIEAAEEAFARISARGAQGDAAAYWIAKCKLRREDHDGAARTLDEALNAFPESRWLAEMRYDRALARYRAGQYEPAVDALGEFLKLHAESPLAPAALQLRASASRALQRYAEARRDCATFATRFADDPAAPSVAFLAAEIEALDGQDAAAAEAYAQFERKYPQDALAATASARLGLLLYRLERFDDAAPRLEQAANADGAEAPAARLALADLAFRAGDWSRAESGFRAYLRDEKAGSAGDALLKLGLALQRQQRHEDALKVFERLLADHESGPHAAQARFERAQALLSLGQEDEAIRGFERVVADEKAERFAPYARRHLASIHLARREPQPARAQLEALLNSKADEELSVDARAMLVDVEFLAGQYERAVELADALAREHPTHDGAGRCAALRAISLARLDRFEPALAAMEKLSPQVRGALGEDLQRALTYEQAWCLRRLDRTPEAAPLFASIAGASGPLGKHAQVELAEIAAAAGDCAKAAEVLASVGDLEALPAALREKATYRAGVCQFQLEKFEPAAKILTGFCDSFPDSELLASAAYFAGEASFRAGRFDAAGRLFGRVVREFPKDPAAEASLLRLGEASAAMQQWAASEQAYVDYLERHRDAERWFQAQFGVGWARENLGRFDEAISAYRVVVDKHKGETAARAQFQIGECLYAKKEFEPAVRELLKVDILYAYPDWSAAALFEAGRCFEQMNKPAEARTQFQTIVDKYGQSRWAQPARQRLAAAPAAAPPGRSP